MPKAPLYYPFAWEYSFAFNGWSTNGGVPQRLIKFDVGHRTENLCLCTCTKLNLRIIAYILQNNVGGINHFIKIRIQRFNMGKIRVERISRQQLCTGSRPAFPCRIAIVRKKILQPERRRIGVLPIAIAGYNGFFRIGIRFIEIFRKCLPHAAKYPDCPHKRKRKCSRQVTDLIKYILLSYFVLN